MREKGKKNEREKNLAKAKVTPTQVGIENVVGPVTLKMRKRWTINTNTSQFHLTLKLTCQVQERACTWS